MSLATVEIISVLSQGEMTKINLKAWQAMLFMLSLISLMFWILTLKMNKTISLTFILLTFTCLLLALGVQDAILDQVAGYFGLLTAANAFWLAFVELVNDSYGEGTEVIPLGHWNSNKFQAAGGAHAPGHIHGHWPFLISRSGKLHNESHKSDGEVAEKAIMEEAA
jgi:GPR1/FUN34/yaaH family